MTIWNFGNEAPTPSQIDEVMWTTQHQVKTGGYFAIAHKPLFDDKFAAMKKVNGIFTGTASDCRHLKTNNRGELKNHLTRWWTNHPAIHAAVTGACSGGHAHAIPT